MDTEHLSMNENSKKVIRREKAQRSKEHSDGSDPSALMANLQKNLGNRAVQRLLAQRKSEGPYELDDETANRIQSERSGGQTLDQGVSTQMSAAMDYDFSQVRVHTSPQADDLSQELNAQAFTTGRDIFFKEGAYEPHSSGGQELLAHELTHVVQQGTGEVGGSGRMMVNDPGDEFERQADASAQAALSPAVGSEVHRQEEEPEEELAQTQVEEEEEPVQAQELEEDEMVQAQENEEEEPVQTQDVEEEALG